MNSVGWDQTHRNFTRYLLSCGKSANTAKTYASNLSIFWRWCAQYEATPYHADRAMVREWIASRLASVSSARVHNDLASLKLFFAWLKETRDRDDDPTEGVRVKRTKALPTQPLEQSDLDKLLATCTNERDRLMVLMLAATGLRISELASLTAEAIDWQRGEIKVRGKGDKERRIAPAPEVLAQLRAWTGMFPSGPLWLSKHLHQPLSAHQMRKILYEIAKKGNLEGIHPHRFRSYFATSYIEQFADIQALQGVMGHDSIETTARYSETTRQRRGLDMMRRLSISGQP